MLEGPNNTLLEMKHIGETFSDAKVLHAVAYDLKPGEVHILAGENGAGKTTLIKILAGVYTDYEGEIWLEEKRVLFKSPHEASLQGISTIHQEMSLVNSMTVADNIFLGREKTHANLWMDYRAQYKKAQGLMEHLGIEVDLFQPIENYPVSIRQMIEIAKALVYDARIIIMDEPTSTLNDIEVSRLFEIIENLKQRGCGIIYISHRLEEIYSIGERITVLRDGRYVGTSATAELAPEVLIQWMVGRNINQQFPPRASTIGDKRLTVKEFFLADPSSSKRWTVQDVSFDLHAGEVLGIAGLQGSGKSELLNGLFGTYGKATQGSIRLDGKPFHIRAPKDSIEQGLVLLTNDRKGTGLIPAMNVVRNVSLASLKSFSPRGWMQTRPEEEAVQEDVKTFDIKVHSLDQEVQTLSGGNQQKVVLAKWLETRPKVLLLDEPTIGVDVGAKHEIYALINKWTSDGLAIILITSELPELLAMSDRIMIMHRGKITAEFSHEQATQEKIIQAAMEEGKVH